MAYWLFKTEPDVFSIDDLANSANKTSMWDGVRNYQARNMLRNQIKKGDQVFIYHSSCKNVGIAGIARVTHSGYPDPTQFDPGNRYYDPKSNPDKPRWYTVDVKHSKTFKHLIPLAKLKSMPELSHMALVKKGNRLSVMPVSELEWRAILTLAA